MRSLRPPLLAGVVLLLSVSPSLSAAHGHDESADMSMASPPADPSTFGPTYFRHGQYGFWVLSHMVLMILAWCILMPLAIMLSVARAKASIFSQLLFHLVNGLAIFAGIVYDSATPDLYPNNAHHPMGWVLTAVTIVWTILSLLVSYSGHQTSAAQSKHGNTAITTEAIAAYNRLNPFSFASRYSRDSGQGTERNSASLYGSHHSRQNSSDSIPQKPSLPLLPTNDNDHDDDDEHRSFLRPTRINTTLPRLLHRLLHRLSTPLLARITRTTHLLLEKFLLPLGFAVLCTGFLTYAGLAQGDRVYSVAAHFVKGGIFFFYGLLTLGRWMGAFAEFGWAWNLRPARTKYFAFSSCSEGGARWKSLVPSAEFTESFVIWLYGSTNVFLEHLGGAGGEWSAQDFEHVSITVLFFGGGLLGMLVESRWVREQAGAGVRVLKSRVDEEDKAGFEDEDEDEDAFRLPAAYRVPLNPMPALTIMLLGKMMAGHRQESMVSTMMHAQWGGLFAAFALARAATYLALYLQPPQSHFASRPPSELVAAFCLTAGGLMFMLSSSDTVEAIESNGLDAMTVFTTTLGLTGVILSWQVVTFAIKGWAVRKRHAVMGRVL